LPAIQIQSRPAISAVRRVVSVGAKVSPAAQSSKLSPRQTTRAGASALISAARRSRVAAVS
jgi:hypothetical protein